MIMTKEILEACKRVNEELQIERFNQRMIHIARCFDYDRFLFIDVKSLETDPLWYNNQFDILMAMPLDELEQHEIESFKITKDYGESIVTQKNTATV